MAIISRAALLAWVVMVSGRASAQVQHAHDVAPVAEATSPGHERAETTLKIAESDTVIYVGDLHCKTCAKKIARRLYTVKGVMNVRTDVAADVAIVSPQPKKTLDVKALWTAAQKAGFPPVKLVGPAGTFEPDPETKGPLQVAEHVASKPE
jgi:copper chaperone CopZ